MGTLARLWNPRFDPRFDRCWIDYGEPIAIAAPGSAQAAELALWPDGPARLRAMLVAREGACETFVQSGEDVAIRIGGLSLLVGVVAVEDDRMLAAFGIPRGSRIEVTLEPGTRIAPGDLAVPAGCENVTLAACRCTGTGTRTTMPSALLHDIENTKS